MAKAAKADWTQEYIRSWHCWWNGYLNGCADPFWSDGVNLNLMRNHMIYYISQGAIVPDNMPLPAEVSYDYRLKAGTHQISMWEVNLL